MRLARVRNPCPGENIEGLVPVQVGVADVESEGPRRAAGGLVDRLPARGGFYRVSVAFARLCRPCRDNGTDFVFLFAPRDLLGVR